MDNDDFIEALWFTVDKHLTGISSLMIAHLTTDKPKQEYGQQWCEELTKFLPIRVK